jgi:hypothetical protein
MSLVDRIGLGCVSLTAHPTLGSALRVLESAFDMGIRHFDTAPAYGRGYSEQILGRFLRGRRDQVTVASKFSPWGSPAPARAPPSLALPLNALKRRFRPPPRPGEDVRGPLRSAQGAYIGKAEVQTQFDASRRRLGTERIDLYLLHEEVPAALRPDALAFLMGLRASGCVGQIGLAANGDYYLPMSPDEVSGWYVLQYEAGRAWPAHDRIAGQFPDQVHIVHSCLKGVARDAASVGEALRAELAARPGGKVLFGSSRHEHIRANLRQMLE